MNRVRAKSHPWKRYRKETVTVPMPINERAILIAEEKRLARARALEARK